VNAQASVQDALTHPLRVLSRSVAAGKISSPTSDPFATCNPLPAQPSVPPSEVDLKYAATLSFGSSSLANTATIPGQDFPVFTTDSTQSTWLPSSSPSLPASSAPTPAPQICHANLPPHQQDFVLFDTPTKRTAPNRSVSQPSANGGVAHHQQLNPAVHSLQTQRVAHVIQATGHSTSSTAFTNRFNPSAQNQFYASSAPSSSVALHKTHRAVRPPVPLFTQSTGGIPQAAGKMTPEDLHALEDFASFEGGASTSYSSPAFPTVYDLNTASSSASNMGTVSPPDLLLQEPFMSAPNSTAITALTSPSIYNESPEFNDSYDVSPNFGSNDFDAGGNDVWFPLFPQEKTAPQIAHNSSVEHSPAEKSDELEVVEPTASRRKSGNSSHSGKHSSVSGVGSKRRDKPLPPIIIDDPSDVVAMKRARNTLAARKSRERKAQRLEELEEQIAKLEEERDFWKNKALSQTD